MLKFVIRDPVFGSKLTFMANIEYGDVCDIVNKKHKTDYEPSNEDAAAHMRYQNSHYIWVKKIDRINPKLTGTLAHEIDHLVSSVLNYVGVEHSTDETDEIPAYLDGFYTEEIYKKIGKIFPPDLGYPIV